jgi:hypothetical protein
MEAKLIIINVDVDGNMTSLMYEEFVSTLTTMKSEDLTFVWEISAGDLKSSFHFPVNAIKGRVESLNPFCSQSAERKIELYDDTFLTKSTDDQHVILSMNVKDARMCITIPICTAQGLLIQMDHVIRLQICKNTTRQKCMRCSLGLEEEDHRNMLMRHCIARSLYSN